MSRGTFGYGAALKLRRRFSEEIGGLADAGRAMARANLAMAFDQQVPLTGSRGHPQQLHLDSSEGQKVDILSHNLLFKLSHLGQSVTW